MPIPTSPCFVENLISLPSYADAVQQYFQLSSKKAALEANKSQAEVESNEEYATLLGEYAEAKARADRKVETIAEELAFSDLEDESFIS